MKRDLFIRLAALALASLMLLSATACGTNTEDSESTEAPTSASTVAETSGETEYVPSIENKDYDRDFNIVIGGTFTPDYIVVDEEDSNADAMSTVVFERSTLVQDRLGVTCVLQDAGSWTEYAANVTKTVQAGDDDYQLVLTPVYQGVCDLITSNVLYDFAEFEAVNLDAPYWNRDLMENIMIGDRYLLGYNDMCLSYVNLIVFNKTIQESYRLESPYAKVRNKTWTLDEFMTMASGIYEDDGNGKRDAADTYGLTGWGWVPLIDFVTASDLRIVDRNAEGNYEIAYEHNREKMIALVDKIFDMYNAESSFFWKSVPDAGTQVDFSAGTCLFQFYSSPGLTGFRDKDIRFGVLPYPLYDQNQEDYRTLNWNGLMGVPNSISDPAMVGEVLELLAYYTAPVKVAYYENLLSAKIADAPDDVEMLDIIWRTQVTDVGIVTCNSSTNMDNLVYMIPKMCEKGSNTFASYVKGNSKNAQKQLDRVFKQGKFAE